jgi:crossover junction endodeoxyribonuclease RuvC
LIYLAIDPGLRSGAWAAIDHDGAYLACGDIQTVGDRIDARRLMDDLHAAVPAGDTAQIIIEDVWVMPKQGSVSSAGFMRATGAIEAVASLMYPVTMVRPQAWKKHFGLIGEAKSGDLSLARVMWPTAPLKLVKHHGRADALLLAQWGLDTLA